MAEIVLVHGIDQQQKSADRLESEWLPSLAGGVRVAGFSAIADHIWRNAGRPGASNHGWPSTATGFSCWATGR